MANESTSRTLLVALILCLVCSVFVSTAAVVLKPRQEVAKQLDKRFNILSVAGLVGERASPAEVQAKFKKIEPRIVDLKTGDYVSGIDPASFNQWQAAGEPAHSIKLSDDQDIAKIKRRENRATIYVVKKDGKDSLYILPVRGYGLWSTLYGFLAVKSDGVTVKGLRFYQEAETPGLGGEVENPKWRALWHGKKLFDKQGDVRIEVVKGGVTENDPAARFKVDALAGATLTSRGVNNLVRFWIGKLGFGPFLAKLRKGEPIETIAAQANGGAS